VILVLKQFILEYLFLLFIILTLVIVHIPFFVWLFI
jgi:hypothetical protein